MESEIILFILQSAVENYVKHGFKEYDNKLHIYVEGRNLTS